MPVPRIKEGGAVSVSHKFIEGKDPSYASKLGLGTGDQFFFGQEVECGDQHIHEVRNVDGDVGQSCRGEIEQG